jgi:hypothetical protein
MGPVAKTRRGFEYPVALAAPGFALRDVARGLAEPRAGAPRPV